MIEVRTIKVNGVVYVQVIERKNGKIDVLKSFGKYTLEAWFEAWRYVAMRDIFAEIVKKVPETELQNLHIAALSVFGFFLGMHEVERIIHAS